MALPRDSTTMKEQFPGFYRPSKAEFDRLWKEGWFVLDANVLLNLYRYKAEARTDYLNVLAQIAARTWIPHQAALEFSDEQGRDDCEAGWQFCKSCEANLG